MTSIPMPEHPDMVKDGARLIATSPDGSALYCRPGKRDGFNHYWRRSPGGRIRAWSRTIIGQALQPKPAPGGHTWEYRA